MSPDKHVIKACVATPDEPSAENPDRVLTMYSLDLPVELLSEMADVLGLDHAFKARVDLILPIFVALGKPATVLKPKAIQDKSRRLKRTFKGLQQVAAKFSGEPKGLENIGLDRVQQAIEEMRRLKGDYVSLTRELDELIRETARSIPLGRRPSPK